MTTLYHLNKNKSTRSSSKIGIIRTKVPITTSTSTRPTTSIILLLYVTYINIFLYAFCCHLQQSMEPYLVHQQHVLVVHSQSQQQNWMFSILRTTTTTTKTITNDNDVFIRVYGHLQSFFVFIQIVGSPLMNYILHHYGIQRTSIIAYSASAISYSIVLLSLSSNKTTTTTTPQIPLNLLYYSKIPTLFQHTFFIAQQAILAVVVMEQQQQRERQADTTTTSSSARTTTVELLVGQKRRRVLTTVYTIGSMIGSIVGGYLTKLQQEQHNGTTTTTITTNERRIYYNYYYFQFATIVTICGSLFSILLSWYFYRNIPIPTTTPSKPSQPKFSQQEQQQQQQQHSNHGKNQNKYKHYNDNNKNKKSNNQPLPQERNNKSNSSICSNRIVRSLRRVLMTYYNRMIGCCCCCCCCCCCRRKEKKNLSWTAGILLFVRVMSEISTSIYQVTFPLMLMIQQQQQQQQHHVHSILSSYDYFTTVGFLYGISTGVTALYGASLIGPIVEQYSNMVKKKGNNRSCTYYLMYHSLCVKAICGCCLAYLVTTSNTTTHLDQHHHHHQKNTILSLLLPSLSILPQQVLVLVLFVLRSLAIHTFSIGLTRTKTTTTTISTSTTKTNRLVHSNHTNHHHHPTKQEYKQVEETDRVSLYYYHADLENDFLLYHHLPHLFGPIMGTSLLLYTNYNFKLVAIVCGLLDLFLIPFL